MSCSELSTPAIRGEVTAMRRADIMFDVIFCVFSCLKLYLLMICVLKNVKDILSFDPGVYIDKKLIFKKKKKNKSNYV
jgi:hypothetical protein